MRSALACLALFVLCSGAAAAQGAASIDTIRVSPRLPTALDTLRVTVGGLGICGAYGAPDIFPPEINGNRIVLRLWSASNCSPPGLFPFDWDFTLGPLPAGTWTVRAVIDDAATFEKILEIDPASTDLFLQDGKFRVRVEWSTPDGALRGNAYAVPLSEESGTLWFFEGSNPEILVKILDGRLVNGHWWVFISSNTSLEFKVHVGQRGPSNPPVYQEKVYVSPAGANKNFIDTTSFQEN